MSDPDLNHDHDEAVTADERPDSEGGGVQTPASPRQRPDSEGGGVEDPV